uniref:Uncharacterized protein n=1 Tax=Sinocyclocheilus grahami TaxID=75366 RepID=A0A672KCE8_SINGR
MSTSENRLVAVEEVRHLHDSASRAVQFLKTSRVGERFRLVSNLHVSSQAYQANTLIYCMGDETADALREQPLSEERARFNERVQQPSEPVDNFITALYALVENCNYGALHDELLRERLAVGLRDSTLSERMQLDRDLTLEKAINSFPASIFEKSCQPPDRSFLCPVHVCFCSGGFVLIQKMCNSAP